MNDINHLLEQMCARMVSNPRDVLAQHNGTARTVYFRVSTHGDDTSKVIGKGGKNVRAIANVIQRMCDNSQISAKVVVETNGERSDNNSEKYSFNAKYSPDTDCKLLEDIGWEIFGEADARPLRINPDTIALMLSVYGEPEPDLEKDLTTIFTAIGKTHGHNLYVELEYK